MSASEGSLVSSRLSSSESTITESLVSSESLVMFLLESICKSVESFVLSVSIVLAVLV